MRIRFVAAALLALSASGKLSAQLTPVSPLPVLSAPTKRAKCQPHLNDPRLAQAHIARMYTVADSADRVISLGIDSTGAPAMFLSAMGETRNGRLEGVTVGAMLSKGVIVRGARTSRGAGALMENQNAPLLATDTVAIRRLIAAVRRVCRA